VSVIQVPLPNKKGNRFIKSSDVESFMTYTETDGTIVIDIQTDHFDREVVTVRFTSDEEEEASSFIANLKRAMS
jgi:hypothetical protein